MAYEKIGWVNRAVEKPMTYAMTNHGDGTVTLARAPGEVYAAGTPVNADNLNHMEAGIAEADALARSTEARLPALVAGNLLHNSDFTRWVAQMGVGASHGTAAVYAGDRWILDSGTVAAEANASGSGYGAVTLSGVIRQYVEMPPAVGTAFVEMVSGEADIAYDAAAGTVTITSAGGVLKNAGLYAGAIEQAPIYTGRSYVDELLCCKRYFRHVRGGAMAGFLAAKSGVFGLPVEASMRVNPTVVASAYGSIRAAGKNITPTGIATAYQYPSVVILNVTYDEQTGVANEAGVLASGADFMLCADLEP